MIKEGSNLVLPFSGVDTPPAATRRPVDVSVLRGHMPALDGLRGIAVLLVVLLHFIGNTTPTNRFESLLVYVFGHGLLGVDLFFVLSGFLITGILYDSWGRPNYYRNFYVRRTLRIFPLYYGTLFAVLVVVPFLGVQSGALREVRGDQVWAWLYGVNFFHALQGEWAMGYLNHFWSLAVEEHFYLLWPLFVGLLRPRPRVLLGASLAVVALSYAGHVMAMASGNETLRFATPFQLHGLALGGFLAVYARQARGLDRIARWLPRAGVGVVAALLASFVLPRFAGVGQEAFGFVRPMLFILGLACLLLWAVTVEKGRKSRFLCSSTMAFFGRYSYGIYVFHHFVSYYFVRHGTEFTLADRLGSHTLAVAVQASLGFGLSVVVAWASYHLYEKHFLRLKSRFAP